MHAMGKAKERQLIWPWEDKGVRDLSLDFEKGKAFAMWIRRYGLHREGTGYTVKV